MVEVPASVDTNVVLLDEELVDAELLGHLGEQVASLVGMVGVVCACAEGGKTIFSFLVGTRALE